MYTEYIIWTYEHQSDVEIRSIPTYYWYCCTGGGLKFIIPLLHGVVVSTTKWAEN